MCIILRRRVATQRKNFACVLQSLEIVSFDDHRNLAQHNITNNISPYARKQFLISAWCYINRICSYTCIIILRWHILFGKSRRFRHSEWTTDQISTSVLYISRLRFCVFKWIATLVFHYIFWNKGFLKF